MAGALLCTGYQAFQCYAHHAQKTDPRWATDVHRFTLVFSLANTAFLVHKAIHARKTLSNNRRITILMGSTAAGLWISLAHDWRSPAISFKDARGQSTQQETFDFPNTQGKQASIQVFKKAPSSIKFNRALITAQLVQIALTLSLGKRSPSDFVQLAATAGSAYGAFSMPWIKIECVANTSLFFSGNPGFIDDRPPFIFRDPQNSATLKNPTLSFFTLLPTYKSGNNCPICLDSADSTYCSNSHAVCKEDAITWNVEAIKEIASKLFYRNNYNVTFVMNEHGSHRDTTYTFKLSRENLPSCPTCREQPSHAFFTFKQGLIEMHGRSTEPKTDFWHRTTALFSVAQLTMAILQYTHPHMAGSIFKTQLAAVALGLPTLIAQQDRLKEPQKLALAVTFVALAALAAYTYFLRENSDHLSSHVTSGLNQRQFETTTILTRAPLNFRLLQGGYLFTAMYAGIAATETKDPVRKKLMLAVAILNGLALLKISQMQWFDVTKRHYSPEGTSQFIDLRFQILVPKPHSMLGKGKFDSFISKVHDYAERFFDGASWYRYWLIHKSYGIETSRELFYRAFIQPKPLHINGTNFFDLIHSWSGGGQNLSGIPFRLKIRTPDSIF